MKAKIQSIQALKDEMLAVARGKRKAPDDAGQVSYESADAILRLLTPDNRKLLALIDRHKPESVAALAHLAHRAEPNVSRTLNKLVASGFVQLREGKGKAKMPEVLIRHVTVNIDVFEQDDRIALA
jgi:predicted transcriptional regulator